MKKTLFLCSAILLLNGCANTMQGALQDTSNNLYQATEYVRQNPQIVDETGAAIKRGGQLIGKGMKATGEYLQNLTQ